MKPIGLLSYCLIPATGKSPLFGTESGRRSLPFGGTWGRVPCACLPPSTSIEREHLARHRPPLHCLLNPAQCRRYETEEGHFLMGNKFWDRSATLYFACQRSGGIFGSIFVGRPLNTFIITDYHSHKKPNHGRSFFF